MATNSELRHASFRVRSGTTGTLNGDMMAAFAADGITETQFNGAFIEWLKAKTPSTNTNLTELKHEFAVSQGAGSWNELGTFTVV